MERVTCVIDATTLVDKIHEIKQWIYNGSIRIHISLQTIEKVEEVYKASLVTKESQKEPPPKKPSSKAARKDVPLFDINPQTTKEFLERVRAGADNYDISFQLPQEQFTQWKEEEQQAIKAEQPVEGPPTSFAQALLRKLNFNDAADANGTRGPSKPRLVARSTSPKSPWKYHKVPNIPTTGVPQTLKPLFSCILWRLHEFENNPLMPETYILLSNDDDTRNLAQKLNIPLKTIAETRQLIKQRDCYNDHRAATGELEKEFGPNVHTKAVDASESIDKHTEEGCSEPQDVFDLGVEALLEQDEDIEELKKTISKEKVSKRPEEKPVNEIDIAARSVDLDADLATPLLPSTDFSDAQTLENVVDIVSNVSEAESTMVSDGDKKTESHSIIESQTLSVEYEDKYHQSTSQSSESPHSPPLEKKVIEVDPHIESDDDEEVVVFKPRSRRTSGLPKLSGEASRPATADGPHRMVEVDQSKRLSAPLGVTQLKPQSPIFVPKNKHGGGNNLSQLRDESMSTSIGSAAAEVQALAPPKPAIQPVRRGQTLHTRRSEGMVQRQSRDIIERQREVIQRQAQVPTRPPPRQIQMQPTSSPAVIDPDAFDRSYVVQPSTSTPTNGTNGTNGNHRSQGPRGSPRRTPRMPEPDVEYVLKSGSPRAATRGRGHNVNQIGVVPLNAWLHLVYHQEVKRAAQESLKGGYINLIWRRS